MRGTKGASSSAGPKDPPLQYEMKLGDFFTIARKVNKEKNGNSLVEKKKLPDGEISTEFTDMGSGICSSWLTCCLGHIAAGRSWKGSIKPNDFALLDGSVHALVIPKPGNSEDRQSDGKSLALQFKTFFVYDEELPSHMDHLINLLERIPRGPLLDDFKNRLQTHCSQMTSKGRFSLVGLLMACRDNLQFVSEFDGAINLARIKAGWYKKIATTRVMRKVAFYHHPIADFENLSIQPPIEDNAKGAFDYIRNYGTHVGEHLKELKLAYHDGYELLIPSTFGNFLANIMDNLLKIESLQEEIAKIAKSCLPSPVQVGVLRQDGAVSVAHNAPSQGSIPVGIQDTSKKIMPYVEQSREAGSRSVIETLQHQLKEQRALVQKLEDDLAEVQGKAIASDQPAEKLAVSGKKVALSIIVIGPTNSGKSTISGHLMYKLGGIQQATMDIIENEAVDMDRQSSRYAWILDKLEAERTKGITMDIKLKKFETPKYSCTIIDSPGHRDYIKNMITGTSQADCAVLVIDSTGSFETASEYALIAVSLGVKQMICCCNKLDATSPPYSRDRYSAIVNEVSLYLKKVGCKLENIQFIPISGFHGDNLVERSKNASWYKGDTVFEAFDKIMEPKRPSGKALRLPLRVSSHLVGGTDSVTAAGCVAAGILRAGMRVKVGPTGKTRKVLSMEMESDKKPLQEAHPGDNISLFFSAAQEEDLCSGYVVSELENQPAMEAVSFNSKVIVTNHIGLTNGLTGMLHCHTACVPVKFDKLLNRIDKKTGEIKEDEPKILKKGEVGTVKMIPCKPVVLEALSVCPALGRFIVRDNNQVVAAGAVMNVETK